MIPIARKNLFSERAKFITSVGGVALAILMMLAILGIYFGSIVAARSIPDNSGVEYWVTQEGSSDMYHTVSILPAGLEGKLKELAGVREASPLLNHATRARFGDEKLTVAVIGYDIKKDVGGPWNIAAGRKVESSGEIVIDRNMAQGHNISIGDQLEIGKLSLKVVGTSRETNTFVFQYVFISKEDAVIAFDRSQVVNYYLLNTDQVDRDELAREVQDLIPNAALKTSDEVAAANVALISESFLPIIAFLVAIGVSVGVAVVGITIYSATSEKFREYGVLKAIGVKDTRLYQIVFEQALISSVSGFILGTLMYWGIEFLAYYYMPVVSFKLDWPYYGYIFALTLVISVIAAFIPIRKSNSIDPALGFKS